MVLMGVDTKLEKKKNPKLQCGRSQSHCERPVKSKSIQWRERLDHYLSQSELKHSDQRIRIAELIVSSPGHLDAGKIVDLVRAKYPEIGVATVYRNIKTLCEASILNESLSDQSGRVVYELATDKEHHDHIICVDCGEVFEFQSAEIEKLQEVLSKDMAFKPVRHRHVIYAECLYGKR